MHSKISDPREIMPNAKILIGIMGPGKPATKSERSIAYTLGTLVAREGWVTLTGGVNTGVMDAASKGASTSGGLTIGTIPRETTTMSRWIEVPIMTDMGRARNAINALSSSVMVVCGMSPGTATEVAFSLQMKKHVIFIAPARSTVVFFRPLGKGFIHAVTTPEQAIRKIKVLLHIR